MSWKDVVRKSAFAVEVKAKVSGDIVKMEYFMYESLVH